MNKSIFGIFRSGSFKFDTEISTPFKCIKYYKTKGEAEDTIKILNDYYHWNTFSNICLWHKRRYNNILSPYEGTFIRRNRDRDRTIYYIIELPDILPSSFQYKLSNDDIISKVIDKYDGNHYLWYTIYCNKIKDVNGKFHIRQYLDIYEEDYEIVNGAIDRFPDSLKVFSFNNLTDKGNYISEDLDERRVTDLRYYDIDIQKLKDKNIKDKGYFSGKYFIDMDNVLFNKSTVYGLYGNIHIPKMDILYSHNKVEELIKEELKKTETLIYNKFVHDISGYRDEDNYIFDKITFEEEMHTAYGGIKWNSQFGYERIDEY